MRPATVHEAETEKLCSSIATKQKCDKVCRRLEATLSEIQEERFNILAEKTREKEKLQAHVDSIRSKSLQNIKDYKQQVLVKHGGSGTKLPTPVQEVITRNLDWGDVRIL